MRKIIGILFLLLFAGFVLFTFLLGGPPSQVYALRDVLLGAASVCALASAALLGMLVLGVGAKGGRRSAWRVPLLCAVALLVSLGFGAFLLTLRPLGTDGENVALDVRLKLMAFVMVAFGLFALGGLIASPLLAKRHNSRLTAA
jgi:hypothetical protein